jgi:hypothetical protein
MPTDKTEEWMKCFRAMTANPLPSCIKKWQTFSCSDGEKYKGYNLISVDAAQGDEAMVVIAKTIFPFCQIPGASWKLEPVTGVTDTLKVLGKKK